MIRFIRGQISQRLCERFNICFGFLQRSAAVEVSSPRWRLRKRLLRILIEHLRHHRDQITYDAIVLDQSFNDRVRQSRLL